VSETAAVAPRPDDRVQRGGERMLVRVTVALLGFCIGYILPSYAKTPNLFYDPLAHTWMFGPNPGPIPLGYLGMCLYGLAGASVGVLVSVLLPTRLATRTFGLLAAWTITALWLSVAYFVWSLWPF
jgi:hypothetical protein